MPQVPAPHPPKREPASRPSGIKKRWYAVDDLRRALLQVVAVLQPKRLRHNWLPKLLSVVIAYVFWFMVTEERRSNIEQGFDVSVAVQDSTITDVRRAVDDTSPNSVRVVLKGKPSRLEGLNPKTIEAIVDITNAPEGSFTRNVTVIPPADTTVVRVIPDKVQGFVDTQLSRNLPVVMSMVSSDDYSLFRLLANPSTVNVYGPSRSVQQVSQVVTSPVALRSGAESEVALLALDAQGKAVSGAKLRPSSVTVRRIDSGELPVKSVRVVLLDPPSGLVARSRVQPLEVRLLGPAPVLQDLREVIGAVEYRVGQYSEAVRLQLPSGVYALDNVSAELEVTQRAVPSELKEQKAP